MESLPENNGLMYDYLKTRGTGTCFIVKVEPLLVKVFSEVVRKSVLSLRHLFCFTCLFIYLFMICTFFLWKSIYFVCM